MQGNNLEKHNNWLQWVSLFGYCFKQQTKQLRGSWKNGNIDWKCDKIWLKIDDTNIIMMMIPRYDNYIEGIF